MTNRNYQKELDDILHDIVSVQCGINEKKPLISSDLDGDINKNDTDKVRQEYKPRLLLHCCCAPCSSYVTEYLHKYFRMTIFYYNPNITEYDEYIKRKEELNRYLSEVPYGKDIERIDADYDPESFFEMAKGHETDPERGERCMRCYYLRLSKTGEIADKYGYDYFCTTLSISPHKDADMIMQIGESISGQCGIPYLPSDFKKKNGYKRSIELSKEHKLYRQNYCGCIYSKEISE